MGGAHGRTYPPRAPRAAPVARVGDPSPWSGLGRLVVRHGARPARAHDRVRAPLRNLQTSHAPPARPPALPRARDEPRASGATPVRGQGAPGRRTGQGTAARDRDARRRSRAPRPSGVPRGLRHRYRPHAHPRMRRVAQQPAAPDGGVRHQRHEGLVQRRAQRVGARRLVGRVVRAGTRLGHSVGRLDRRSRRARRRRSRVAGRPPRARGGPALLPARVGLAALRVAGSRQGLARRPRPSRLGPTHGARLRALGLRARG